MEKEFQKFDPSVIEQNLKALIPNGYPQERLVTGNYEILTFWDKGILNRIDIDSHNISDIIGAEQAQMYVKNILTNSKRFKNRFTGHVKLTAKLENHKLINLHKEDSRHIDPKNISEILPRTLPNNPFKTINDGMFSIATRWRGGDMKEVVVDNIKIDEDYRMDIETNIEKFLQKIHCGRKFFSGKRIFVVKMKSGEVKNVVYKEGNFIINSWVKN